MCLGLICSSVALEQKKQHVVCTRARTHEMSDVLHVARRQDSLIEKSLSCSESLEQKIAVAAFASRVLMLCGCHVMRFDEFHIIN